MIKNTRLQMIAMLAVGGLLGYAVASGNLEFRKASAEPPNTTAGRISNPSYQESSLVKAAAPSCCSEGANKGQLIALANPSVQDNADVKKNGKNGKKPNIVVV